MYEERNPEQSNNLWMQPGGGAGPGQGPDTERPAHSLSTVAFSRTFSLWEIFMGRVDIKVNILSNFVFQGTKYLLSLPW